MYLRQYAVIACLLSFFTTAFAETKYVTDEFEIMLRTGQSTQHEILRQLKSGTQLEILQSNQDYTQVRTRTGQEGWVLTRYLINQPAGRDRAAAFQKRYEDLKATFDARLERDKSALNQRIAELEELSKKPLQLQKEIKVLESALQEEKERYAQLSRETEVLKSPYKDRQWFVSGAIVSIGSLIFGMILMKLPKGKRKKWNEL